MPQTQPERVPNAMQHVYDAVIKLTDDFCATHLDEEYAALCRKAAAALARKRPSPLLSGKLVVWACAIVHAVGSTNFLFDKSQTPHMRADHLAELFGVGKSTASKRASDIMDWLKMGPYAPNWFRPSQAEENPLVWMLEVDGYIIDIRDAPRELQEEAFELGLIPYVPADKQA